jgi:hypothetical protein
MCSESERQDNITAFTMALIAAITVSIVASMVVFTTVVSYAVYCAARSLM